MYNRYIPQPDGTYRRNRIQEAQRQPAPQPQTPCNPPQAEEAPCQPAPPQNQGEQPNRNRSPSAPRRYPNKPQTNVSGFLRKLLPQDFGTEDLLVVLLLLLMAGDSQEDQNHALLTLALYLFL